MSEEEKSATEIVSQIAQDFLDDRESRREPQRERELVPIKQWLTPRFIGSMATNLWPFWRDKLIEYFEGDYTEILIDGSIGSGKTTFSSIALVRKIYELTTFDYPQRFVGVDDQSELFFAYFSVTNDAAQDTGFADIYSLIQNSSYFREEIGMNEEYETKAILPSKNLVAIYGANKSAILGKDLLGLCLDEANFWKASGSGKEGNIEAPRKIYNDATDRRQNRFMNKGFDPGISILASSSANDASFLEKRKEKAGESAFEITARIFQVRPGRYSDAKFPVFKGSESEDPQVVRTIDQFLQLIESLEMAELLDDEIIGLLDNIVLENAEPDAEEVDVPKDLLDDLCGRKVNQLEKELPVQINRYFVFPPIDFKSRFEDDIISSIQNVGGEAVGQSGTFFSDKEAWDACIEPSLQHPFTQIQPTVTTAKSEEQIVEDLFRPEVICEKAGEKDDGTAIWQPKRHADSPRSIHIDLAQTTDPAAISMSHVSEVTADHETGIARPHIEMDFMLRMLPPDASEGVIYFDAIEYFVFALNNRFGFDIRSITLDQYQSAQIIQNFENQLFKNDDDKKAEVFSTDSSRNEEAWLWSARQLGNEKFSFYDYAPLRHEWFELIHDRDAGKVDHPKTFSDGSTGHNDVSCTFVGSTWNLTKLPSSSSEDVGGRGDVGIEERSTKKDELQNMDDNYTSSRGTRPFQDAEKARSRKQDKSIIEYRL